jgi:hypothetical protein
MRRGFSAFAVAGSLLAGVHGHHVRPVNYKKQYLALVAPANKLVDKLVAEWDAKPTPSNAAALKDAGPYIAATETFDNRALRDLWPTGVRGDIKALVVADGQVIAAIEALGSVTVLDSGSVRQQLMSAFTAEGTAANIVRSDLGLPANS